MRVCVEHYLKMTAQEKELTISRIIMACFRCEIKDNYGRPLKVIIKNPTRFQNYIANEIYMEALQKAELEGNYTEYQYLCLLKYKGIWSDEQQAILDNLGKDIEQLKIDLYNSAFRSEQKKQLKIAINKIRDMQERLHRELHEYDHLTANGIAMMAKHKYMVACSIYKMNNEPLFPESELDSIPDFVIEAVAENISANKISDGDIRELARTDPWKLIWLGRKSEGSVFNIPAVDLTNEQRILSIWSNVYDNIHEHPDCPADEIINDDDMMDGWMLVQKRKRDASRGVAVVDGLVQNEKIRSAEEVFVPADSVADAKKVDSFNDFGASMTKKKRLALIHAKGAVREQDMPDSQLKMQAEYNRLFMERAHGK